MPMDQRGCRLILHRKVHYRGIVKNGAQVFVLLALANVYLASRALAST